MSSRAGGNLGRGCTGQKQKDRSAYLDTRLCHSEHASSGRCRGPSRRRGRGCFQLQRCRGRRLQSAGRRRHDCGKQVVQPARRVELQRADLDREAATAVQHAGPSRRAQSHANQLRRRPATGETAQIKAGS